MTTSQLPPSRSSDPKVKFLGMAFAGADLAFEIDPQGVVTMAIGAVEQLTGVGRDAFIGQNWSAVIVDDDAGLLDSLLRGLSAGERKGPVRVGLKPKKAGGLTRFASLSVFRLPQNGDGLSCALSLGGPALSTEFQRNQRGLLDAATFDEATVAAVADAARSGHPVAMALVQLTGLDASMAGLDADSAEAARKEISAALRLESYAGMGASEIAPERFAFLRPAAGSVTRITERLQEVCGGAVTPTTADLQLDGPTPADSLKAVRYALDRFIESGPEEAASDFSSMLERTTRETARFRSTLTTGAFNLVYQPVIDLARNRAHHYEALARFEGAESPAQTIQLAEQVGMIVDFDLAVAKIVVGELAKGERSLKIAVNLSAVSLMTPRCIEALAALTASQTSLRTRLLIEVTETQKLADLPAANRVIASLRKMGHPVCLDDFGAGAASLDYLSGLDVEYVKIDGRYIKALDRGPRDAMVIKHVAALCKDLGVSVIAEMVETQEAAEVIQGFGVPLAQGWLFGKPAAKPVWEAPYTPGPSAARRRGEVEGWG